jgi:glutamate formiminotransferase / 5-formyltetrahydrofolate cyclo-ligase
MAKPLLAVPNFSEARHLPVIDALSEALTASPGARLLDVHSDVDHNRTVFTLTAPQGQLAAAVGMVAARAAELIEIDSHEGVHPRVGAIDVAPIVYLDQASRGAANAEALALASILGDTLHIPVFLYGPLSGHHVTRSDIRRGGIENLARRLESGAVKPDFGPGRLHPRAGAVLVAARAPLVAFNIEIAAPADLQTAKRIAALIRDGGHDGLPSVRALGLTLSSKGGIVQVSTNIDDYTRTSPSELVAAVSRHARILRTELIGLAPRCAFADFPADIEVQNLRFIEDAVTD